jgi:hypothetical protein
MTDIKPCPFCGSEQISVWFRRARRKEGYQATFMGRHVGQTRTMYGSLERAVEEWNRRHVDSERPSCGDDGR